MPKKMLDSLAAAGVAFCMKRFFFTAGILALVPVLFAGKAFAGEACALRPVNRLSSEASFLGTGLRYERTVNNFLTLGAAAFIDVGAPIEINGAAGVMASARFFPLGLPIYLEAGLGWGFISRRHDLRIPGRYDLRSDYRPISGTSGLMLYPGIGARFFVRPGSALFLNPFVGFPMVFAEPRWRNYEGGPGDSAEYLRVGLGVGFAW